MLSPEARAVLPSEAAESLLPPEAHALLQAGPEDVLRPEDVLPPETHTLLPSEVLPPEAVESVLPPEAHAMLPSEADPLLRSEVWLQRLIAESVLTIDTKRSSRPMVREGRFFAR